ncbi:MAG: sulfite exporter TauE/SafE family protein [Candidatus Micrarchaeota archaeon]
MQELAIFLWSIMTSFVSVMLGIGGGNFNVPFLTLFLGVDFKNAATASLLTASLASLSASAYNRKKRVIDYKTAFVLVPPLILGAVVGPFIPLPARYLEILFGIVVLAFGIITRMGIKIGLFHSRFGKKEMILLAFLIGLLASMIGIGGGIIIVPLLSIPLAMPMKKAVATSTFIIIFTTLTAFISQTLNGNFDISVALPMALPVIFTGYVGAYFMHNKIRDEHLRKFFELVLILLAGGMLFRGILG